MDLLAGSKYQWESSGSSAAIGLGRQLATCRRRFCEPSQNFWIGPGHCRKQAEGSFAESVKALQGPKRARGSKTGAHLPRAHKPGIRQQGLGPPAARAHAARAAKYSHARLSESGPPSGCHLRAQPGGTSGFVTTTRRSYG